MTEKWPYAAERAEVRSANSQDVAPKLSKVLPKLCQSFAKVASNFSQSKINISDPSRDVLKEFQLEIEEVVKQVALEYVSQYPNPLGVTGTKGNGLESGDSLTTIATQGKEMEERIWIYNI